MLIYSRVVSAARYSRSIGDLAVTAKSAVATMSGQTGQVQVELTIDLARVAFEQRGPFNVGSIEVAVFGVTSDQHTVGQSWQTLELNYTDARLARVRRDGLSHSVVFQIAAAVKDLKIVVYDYGADLIGSVVATVVSK
jgi:hypothetical protein